MRFRQFNPPLAVADSYNVAANSLLTITAPGILQNDYFVTLSILEIFTH